MSSLKFTPPVFLRNKHLQTILASKCKPFMGDMLSNEQSIHLNVYAGEPVTLTGRYSPQTIQKSKGLVVMLHGWLGCVDSTYMVSRGESIYKEGFDVFRLNMRDHGDSAGLNQGLFHACRLEEVYQAIAEIAQWDKNKPIHLIGFSLGGSFALRIGWRNSQAAQPIPNLKQIIAICPSIEPEAVFKSIDDSTIYRTYFSKKLRNSLITKQKSHPDLYDFTPLLKLNSCRAITERLIADYLDFPNIQAYFTDYRFCEEKLKSIAIPVHILISKDDPVIPIIDFKKLEGVNTLTKFLITQQGGHVGYVTNFKGKSWLDTYLKAQLTCIS